MIRWAIVLLAAYGTWCAWEAFLPLPDPHFGQAFGVTLTVRLAIAIAVGAMAWRRTD